MSGKKDKKKFNRQQPNQAPQAKQRAMSPVAEAKTEPPTQAAQADPPKSPESPVTEPTTTDSAQG